MTWVLHQRHLLDIFDHIPQRKIGLGLAWSLLHGRKGCLNRNGNLLAVHGLLRHGRMNGNRSGVLLLGHEFLTMVDGVMRPGLLGLIGLSRVLLVRRSLLLLLDKLLIKVING